MRTSFLPGRAGRVNAAFSGRAGLQRPQASQAQWVSAGLGGRALDPQTYRLASHWTGPGATKATLRESVARESFVAMSPV